MRNFVNLPNLAVIQLRKISGPVSEAIFVSHEPPQVEHMSSAKGAYSSGPTSQDSEKKAPAPKARLTESHFQCFVAHVIRIPGAIAPG
ncbi:MAG: hypothetical protein DME84_11280 [Verrucomicrobia bacterium]|nr:MAG: hypothetical protein DME84_11280 [Verrucomicrobiota bacterium]